MPLALNLKQFYAHNIRMALMIRIRKGVFGETQRGFAKIAGTSQGTVSRWESSDLDPSRKQLARIRAEARRRNLRWNDAWFFDANRSIRSTSHQRQITARKIGCGRRRRNQERKPP
jgi:transcriptional regulator with XRE-family HTH domain